MGECVGARHALPLQNVNTHVILFSYAKGHTSSSIDSFAGV